MLFASGTKTLVWENNVTVLHDQDRYEDIGAGAKDSFKKGVCIVLFPCCLVAPYGHGFVLDLIPMAPAGSIEEGGEGLVLARRAGV